VDTVSIETLKINGSVIQTVVDPVTGRWVVVEDLLEFLQIPRDNGGEVSLAATVTAGVDIKHLGYVCSDLGGLPSTTHVCRLYDIVQMYSEISSTAARFVVCILASINEGMIQTWVASGAEVTLTAAIPTVAVQNAP
jgi:hypothetical protein